ncbi:acyl carrier protein [Pseudogemmobacter sonorensis]|uniref:acyl carrier protein n=1 Tax=Pseudogemmobacter sonorensis TaxID=2989681 RepID=UPI0036C6F89E
MRGIDPASGPATDEGVARRVVEILARQALLDPADLDLAASPEALGLDSLALVEAVFAIEEAFDISVPFNAAEPGGNAGDPGFDASTIASIIAAVEDLVARKPA